MNGIKQVNSTDWHASSTIKYSKSPSFMQFKISEADMANVVHIIWDSFMTSFWILFFCDLEMKPEFFYGKVDCWLEDMLILCLSNFCIFSSLLYSTIKFLTLSGHFKIGVTNYTISLPSNSFFIAYFAFSIWLRVRVFSCSVFYEEFPAWSTFFW